MFFDRRSIICVLIKSCGCDLIKIVCFGVRFGGRRGMKGEIKGVWGVYWGCLVVRRGGEVREEERSEIRRSCARRTYKEPVPERGLVPGIGYLREGDEEIASSKGKKK
jgi:hypothetical protein